MNVKIWISLHVLVKLLNSYPVFSPRRIEERSICSELAYIKFDIVWFLFQERSVQTLQRYNNKDCCSLGVVEGMEGNCGGGGKGLLPHLGTEWTPLWGGGKIRLRVAKNKTNAARKRWPKQLKVLKRKLSHPPFPSSPVFNQRSFFLCTLRPRLQIIKYYSHVWFISRNTEKLSVPFVQLPSSFFQILINAFSSRGKSFFLFLILIYVFAAFIPREKSTEILINGPP